MFAFQMLVSEREGELSSLKGELDVLEKEEGDRQASMADLRHERDKHTTSLKDDEDKENCPRATSEEELLSVNRRELECESAALGEKLEQMTPNMAAIEEYRRKEEQHRDRLKELDQVTSDRDDARNKFDELRKERLDRFMKGFSTITNKLKEMYQVCVCVCVCVCV